MKWFLIVFALASCVPAFSQTAQGFTQAKLSTGTLYVPVGYPLTSHAADVIVHFHGADSTVTDNLTQSGKKACLVVINTSGLSEAYAKLFRDDPQLFSRILGETKQKLTEQFKEPIQIRKLVVTSFGAGYGAVREILKSTQYFGMITDIVLADSLCAGYVQQSGKNVPDPANMKDFRVFASLAAGSRKTMIITHSQIVPGTHASTIETADVLIAAAHATRIPNSSADATTMLLESAADRGRFHVRGYLGTTEDDHVNHLRQMREALKLTSLP